MRVISEHLRQSARDQSCTLRLSGICNRRRETVVLAHLPVPGFKGCGMKVPDLFACFACSSCHDALDRHMVEIDGRDLLRALAETQMHWIESGLLKVKGNKRARA